MKEPLMVQTELDFRILTDVQPDEGLPDVEDGRPGDGSGMDDLADYNQNEADDYRDEY